MKQISAHKRKVRRRRIAETTPVSGEQKSARGWDLHLLQIQFIIIIDLTKND